MEKILITTSFGLESLVKFQLRDMGYKDYEVSDGLISLKGDLSDLAKLNINLKHADRVYLEVASFKAMDFEELFENVNKIAWQDILNEDSNFIVKDIYGSASKYEGKVLIIRGTKDSLVFRDSNEKLRDAYPNARYFEIEGADHSFTNEDQRKILYEMSYKFFEEN